MTHNLNAKLQNNIRKQQPLPYKMRLWYNLRMICELPMRDKYDASDFKVLDEFAASVYASEGEVMPGLDSRADSDCDRSRPICIGMDYNANIN